VNKLKWQTLADSFRLLGNPY